MPKRQLTEVNVAGKRVLVRVDFNVPLENGRITDDTRIRSAMPTIQWLLEHDAKIILCSHLGRPKGKIEESLRLKPIAEHLELLLGQPVTATDDVTGTDAQNAVDDLDIGEIVLLENLRFDSRE